MNTSRVLLAEHQDLLRAGLKRVLEGQGTEFQVVATCSEGREAVRLAEKFRPHVIVIDLQMPGLNGVEATREIMRKAPEMRILGMSRSGGAQQITDALRAGVRGFMLKNCAVTDILHGIRAVRDGLSYLDPRIAGLVIAQYLRWVSSLTPSPLDILDAGERQVLQLLAEGQTTKSISRAMALGIKSIEARRTRVMKKLGIKTIAGLTKFAVMNNLTRL